MIQVIAIGLLAIALFGGGSYVGYQYSDGQHAKSEILVRDAKDAFVKETRAMAAEISNDVEDQLKKDRANHNKLTNEGRNEVSKNPVLTDPGCAYPASTVRLRNKARGYDDGQPPGLDTDGKVRPVTPAPGGKVTPSR